MVRLDFNECSIINKKRCPYFFKVEENGNMISLVLTDQAWQDMEEYLDHKFVLGRDNRFNFYENGKINISELWYNGRNEEWEEELVYEFKDKQLKEMKGFITFMLNFTASLGQYGKRIGQTFEEIIEYLKKGDF